MAQPPPEPPAEITPDITAPLSPLQQSLVDQQQVEAANTVALIEAIVDGRLDLHEVDFNALQAKVTALNTLLDGDPNSEGYQAFQSLVDKLDGLQTQIAQRVHYNEMTHGLTLAAQAFIDTLWEGRTRPAGLPNADGSVSS